jgi:hypothetical protein
MSRAKRHSRPPVKTADKAVAAPATAASRLTSLDDHGSPTEAVHAPPAASASPLTHLVLVLGGSELAAWLVTPEGKPAAVDLQGDKRAKIGAPDALAAAVDDLAERLRGEGTVVGQIHWLADAAGRQSLRDSFQSQKEKPDSPPWQIIAWEWLAARFGHPAAATPWEILPALETELLPWLATPGDAAERRQLKESREHEHQTESDRLVAERAQLLRENERLRTQNAALRQVDKEHLVSYLPALFSSVFNVIGAADLALLCGHIEPLSIPNPYPEPSDEALHTLQKRFRALPPDLQRQIVGFVTSLPHRQRLNLRPEMRELVHELEEELNHGSKR